MFVGNNDWLIAHQAEIWIKLYLVKMFQLWSFININYKNVYQLKVKRNKSQNSYKKGNDMLPSYLRKIIAAIIKNLNQKTICVLVYSNHMPPMSSHSAGSAYNFMENIEFFEIVMLFWLHLKRIISQILYTLIMWHILYILTNPIWVSIRIWVSVT